jgi:hypothetical protein
MTAQSTYPYFQVTLETKQQQVLQQSTRFLEQEQEKETTTNDCLLYENSRGSGSDGRRRKIVVGLVNDGDSSGLAYGSNMHI